MRALHLLCNRCCNFEQLLGLGSAFSFLFFFCCIYCMKLKETSKLKHRVLGIAGIALRNEFLLLPPLPLSPQPVCGFWKIWAETKRDSDENSHSLTLYQSISFSLSSLSSSQFFILKNLSHRFGVVCPCIVCTKAKVSLSLSFSLPLSAHATPDELGFSGVDTKTHLPILRFRFYHAVRTVTALFARWLVLLE